ncbi:putative A1 protein [Stappia phage SI01]|uniref:A1 protein n=1 Tax=Stappia phage SI01 TaxID=2847766 RepID=A0AAE7VIH0_9CAUD|nr:putative A1 protein [Stappia phage SI01]
MTEYERMARTFFDGQLRVGIKMFEEADRNLEASGLTIDARAALPRTRRRQLWRAAKRGEPIPEEAPTAPIINGELRSPDEKRERLPGQRFVVTSAQNNTYLHEDFWNALQGFAKKHDARLLVSRFTYNKSGYRNNGGVEGVNGSASGDGGIWYDERIMPFTCDKQVKLADDLVFCGELDILPTAATPLSGLMNYTGPNSGIVPHAKVHAQSFATMLHSPAKIMYTTGTVTLRNYLDRKAGQVATFHHTFAALYVEVDDEGDWFVRQLIADDNGVFYDLDTAYGPGWEVPATTMGETVVTLGDIHVEKVDPLAVSGAIQMAAAVRAAHITVHDLIDFTHRNHHNVKDAHFLVEQHFGGIPSVEAGMEMGVRFLHGLSRAIPHTKLHVIRSNHDQAFERWLKDVSAFNDPANAGYWCLANATLMLNAQSRTKFEPFVWAMRHAARKQDIDLNDVHFVEEDESLVINGIEHGMHGHRGPNGARGNPKAFRQMGSKVNTAHTHSCGIIDGVWTAGTLSNLDLGYNRGPSSWSHSCIVTYPSGKRTLITQRGPKWRAE